MLGCSNNRGYLVYHTENYTQSYMYHKIVYPGSRFHMVAYGSGSSWHCKKRGESIQIKTTAKRNRSSLVRPAGTL